MTTAATMEVRAEPVVIDTMIAGAMITTSRGSLLTRYRPLLLGHPLVLAFATVAELRYGAYRNGWGDSRLAKLEQFSWPLPRLITSTASVSGGGVRVPGGHPGLQNR